MRSETDAFKLAVGAALVVGVSILVGFVASALAGALVFAALFVIALVAWLRAANPDRPTPLRSAARAPHPHGAARGRRHVLVVANEALEGEELRQLVLGSEGRDVEVDVLAPVLTSRLHMGTSDIDHELREARQRLSRSLEWARAEGIDARGEVGDPSATVAIADELRDFGADEIIIVTHPEPQAGRQEREELERLRSELDVPVRHVVL